MTTESYNLVAMPVFVLSQLESREPGQLEVPGRCKRAPDRSEPAPGGGEVKSTRTTAVGRRLRPALQQLGFCATTANPARLEGGAGWGRGPEGRGGAARPSPMSGGVVPPAAAARQSRLRQQVRTTTPRGQRARPEGPCAVGATSHPIRRGEENGCSKAKPARRKAPEDEGPSLSFWGARRAGGPGEDCSPLCPWLPGAGGLQALPPRPGAPGPAPRGAESRSRLVGQRWRQDRRDRVPLRVGAEPPPLLTPSLQDPFERGGVITIQAKLELNVSRGRGGDPALGRDRGEGRLRRLRTQLEAPQSAPARRPSRGGHRSSPIAPSAVSTWAESQHLPRSPLPGGGGRIGGAGYSSGPRALKASLPAR
ncbi:translation initiation factor IF-2-like [Nycticebus coucang]|uniref:translation initiation factor IF-2-like n=1 Tax=Nycticebus coucang TaxID=9470 RepID=UPI00234E2F4B|nr:translation initiation factor IF-2-like [Nycticebus coucang]